MCHMKQYRMPITWTAWTTSTQHVKHIVYTVQLNSYVICTLNLQIICCAATLNEHNINSISRTAIRSRATSLTVSALAKTDHAAGNKMIVSDRDYEIGHKNRQDAQLSLQQKNVTLKVVTLQGGVKISL